MPSPTYTAANKFLKGYSNQPNWDVFTNANLDQLDALSALAGGAVSPTEIPSTTLNVRVSPCAFVAIDGTIHTTSATPTLALAPSIVNQVYQDNAGILHAVTTGFPTAGAGFVPLAAILTGATSIIMLVDQRQFLQIVGYRRASASQTALTDSTTGSTAAFVIADVGAAFNQATLNANFARITRLLNEIQAALVERQQIKGSA